MFLNSGRKIKVIAKVVFVIGIVFSVIIGIALIVAGAQINSSYGMFGTPGGGTGLIIFGIFYIPIGVVIAYVAALFLSGYGQIVENTDLLVGRPEEQAPAQPISANQVWQSAKTTASGVVNGVKQGVADAHAANRAEQPQGVYQPQPQAQPQGMYQPQPQVQPQEAYQPQPQVQPQEVYQPQPQVQPQEVYQPQPQVQPQEKFQPQPFEEAAMPSQPEPSVPENASVKYCGQCGTPNEADYEFCINCGSKLG